MGTTFDSLRAHAAELGSRILKTYPPLQSTKIPSLLASQRCCVMRSLPRLSRSPARPSTCRRQKPPALLRVWRWEDLHGSWNDPCRHRRPPERHASHVPLPHHA